MKESRMTEGRRMEGGSQGAEGRCWILDVEVGEGGGEMGRRVAGRLGSTAPTIFTVYS